MLFSTKKENEANTNMVIEHDKRLALLESGLTSCRGDHRRHDDWKVVMGNNQESMKNDLSKIAGLIETYAPLLKIQQDNATANSVWGKRILYAAAIVGAVMTICGFAGATFLFLIK